MSIDGLFCACLANELKALEGAKIEKISQTGGEELIFQLYSSRRLHLLLSASRQNARVCLVPDMPVKAPLPSPFCMLLRKHLAGGRVERVFAPENERIICFDIKCKDELGYACDRRIYAELMGKYSNLILTGGDGRVLGALYLTDLSFSARAIMAGLPYEGPPRQEKASPRLFQRSEVRGQRSENGRELFLGLCEKNYGCRAADFLLKNIACFSPLTARETAFRANIELLDKRNAEHLWDIAGGILNEAFGGAGKPCIVEDKDGVPVAFSFTLLRQYGAGFRLREHESLSETLCAWFGEKGRKENKDRRSSDLKKLLDNLKNRIVKKMALHMEKLAECAGKDGFRRCGDLIIGSIYLLKQGMEKATLPDYETGETAEIPLDRRLSPADNAAAYYKKYTKLKYAEAAVRQRIEITEEERRYIESVADAAARAETDAEFDELRAELAQAGYIKAARNAKGRKSALLAPLEYKIGEFVLRVGRNNLQNDKLTFSSDKKDIWFHVKNAPGSHAVLQTGGKEPEAEVYTRAAQIAAYHSSQRGNKNTAVDYAPVRFVKKPPGSAPGRVEYTRYYTAYVDGII